MEDVKEKVKICWMEMAPHTSYSRNWEIATFDLHYPGTFHSSAMEKWDKIWPCFFFFEEDGGKGSRREGGEAREGKERREGRKGSQKGGLRGGGGKVCNY